ncbi:hypothetical protein Sjap_021753 [Stephania japonica]|uniref:F-box domain-containing protein n=1 Tax=Stephania japonica TaxID=461633 RepID=A0AAP0HTS4_9MAGN
MIGEVSKTGKLEFSFEQLVLGGLVGGDRMNNMGWKDLPMELLLRIVSLVDGRTVIVASGVCTGWREAICLGLTRLSLSWCKKNMNNLVLALAPKFTKLQVLSLRQTIPQLEDNAVESVANCCSELLDLDLSKSFKLTDRSLYALAHGCQRITKLNISGCTAFSDVALSYLSGFCRNLRSLNLCGCTKAASDRALKAIAHNCNRLQYLNLGWCEFVGDAGVISLARWCPDIRELDLCGCSLITGAITRLMGATFCDLVAIARAPLPQLRSQLRLEGGASEEVGRSQRGLQYCDDSIVALAEGCFYLRSLDLYQCHNITDRAMYSLANRRMTSKRDLWKPVGSRYDEGLVNLNLGQCTGLTAQAVQAVCDSFPSLHTCLRQSLTISGCLNLVSVHCTCTTGSPIL